jgi:hypothetical protein
VKNMQRLILATLLLMAIVTIAMISKKSGAATPEEARPRVNVQLSAARERLLGISR